MLNNIFGKSNEELMEKFSKLEERISKLEERNNKLEERNNKLEEKLEEYNNNLEYNIEDLSESIEIIALILGQNPKRGVPIMNIFIRSINSIIQLRPNMIKQKFKEKDIKYSLRSNITRMKNNGNWKKIKDNMDKIRLIEFNLNIGEIIGK